MVARLAELGTGVTWEQVSEIAGDGVVGRPHIARALAASGAIAEPADAFTPEWIGDGGRAFVDRYAPDLARAVTLIRAAGGVPVLAHPRSPGYEIPDAVIAELTEAGLCGIEVFHFDHDEAERMRLSALARSLDLIATGGSDDHGSFNGRGLGADVTPAEEYAPADRHGQARLTRLDSARGPARRTSMSAGILVGAPRLARCCGGGGAGRGRSGRAGVDAAGR